MTGSPTIPVVLLKVASSALVANILDAGKIKNHKQSRIIPSIQVDEVYLLISMDWRMQKVELFLELHNSVFQQKRTINIFYYIPYAALGIA